MDHPKQPPPQQSTEDGRSEDVGQGYPEVSQAGTSPRDGTDQGPEADQLNADDADKRDGDSGQATGNPRAAGAD